MDKIRARDLNRRERLALYRVWRYFRDSQGYSGCTSVRYELHRVTASAVSLSVKTRRSDCAASSVRAVLCGESAHLFIGPRGGLRVASAETGICGTRKERASHRAHVARMVRGRTISYRSRR